jgi:hypothetical protein
MADINEVYGIGGNFLKTNDIPKGQIIEVTIKSADIKTLGADTKLALELDTGKTLVLNTTNARQLASNLETPEISSSIMDSRYRTKSSNSNEGRTRSFESKIS